MYLVVCLDCWNTLCGSEDLPNNFDGCPQSASCLGGITPGIIFNDPNCCIKANNTYVSGVSDTLISNVASDYISQQCEPSLSSVLSNDSGDGVDQDSGGKQYVLYSSMQFNCTGCISNISIYSKLKVVNKEVFVAQIWTPKRTQSNENETILELSHESSFDLQPDTILDQQEFNQLFITSNNSITDSFCFEPGDIFGITASGSFKFDLRKNSKNDRKTYARELPNCQSLKTVYYLEDDELVDEPLISLGIIQNISKMHLP